MSQWTESAKAKLERYLAEIRESLAASGADVNEVTDDLRRHVEEEVAAHKLTAVTEQDVAQILARIGAPEVNAVGAAGASSHPGTGASARVGTAGVSLHPEGVKRGFLWKFGTALLLLFGVVLPLGTVVFEFLTGACAGVLFDPMPTIGHVALVAFVPLANLAVWIAVLRSNERWRSRLGWANGIAIGVGLVYALLFLPATPFALIGILFFGFGFVPLAPLLAFICAMILRRQLRPLPGLWPGMGLGVAALVVFTLPMILTEVGLSMASSDSPAESTRGVRWLRTWGQDEMLLRACYGRSGRSGELYQWGKKIAPDAARTIYYRVHGRAFNSVPPPKLYAGRARWDLMEEEFTWDADQAGDTVAGCAKGLSLASSRQDVIIYPEAGLGYSEWTLEFKNDSRLQREARAQIQLPPGGVVSRLTLWIDGEEREAAFGGRSQVKTAYKEVVERRRDPVLVTTCGPDRVLMQCFPVPPDGGRMKLRLGVVAPLALTAADTGCFRWPCFIERNFAISEQVQHAVWVESSQPIEAPVGKLKAEAGKPGIYTLRGQLRDHELSAPVNTVRARRPASSVSAWSRDTRSATNQIIHQAIVERPVTPPDRVIVVVDGTKGIETSYAAISAALTRLPTNIDFALLLARDGCEEIEPLQKGTADLYHKIALPKFQSPGGHDNVPALIRACDLAAQGKAGAIVWIHGPQPVLLELAEELRQRFERSANPPLLLEVQVQPGPNRVLEKLDGLKAVRSVSRLGELEDDLGRLFGNWSGKSGAFEYVREQAERGSSAASTQGTAAEAHLVRLWAAEEVSRLCAARRFDEATRLAARYQLVTPVSGAVVLETKAQYERAGLQPAPATSVPTVPEPSGGVLLVVGLVVFGVSRRLRGLRYGSK
jgi:hypothetical protein